MNVLRLCLDADLHDSIGSIAEEQGVTQAEILRRGLSVIKAFRAQKRAGRDHLGFVADPTRLDVEIVGILN